MSRTAARSVGRPIDIVAAEPETVPAFTRAVVLARRPHGHLRPDDLRLRRVPLPRPAAGQVVVRNVVMSLDPAARGRMDATEKVYTANFDLGAPLDGWAVGRVIASRAAEVPVGSAVRHRLGWRELAVLDASATRALDLAVATPEQWLSALGQTGFTAFVGLTRIGGLTPGETVLISAAAGGVGSIAAQLARLFGAGRVIGTAGGPAKCSWLVERLRLDGAIDHRREDLRVRLAELAGGGVDLYFDNVGGHLLAAALREMRPEGRVTLCGMVSTLQAAADQAPIGHLIEAVLRRLTLRGFIVRDHEDLRPEFESRVSGWLASGELVDHCTVFPGLDQAPEALVGLLDGANTGKALVRIGPGPS